jgi:hypothetical protein
MAVKKVGNRWFIVKRDGKLSKNSFKTRTSAEAFARNIKGKGGKSKARPRKAKSKGRGTTAKKGGKKRAKKKRTTKKRTASRRGRRGGRRKKGTRRNKGLTLGKVANIIIDPMTWAALGASGHLIRGGQDYAGGNTTAGNQRMKWAAATIGLGAVASAGYKALGIKQLVGGGLSNKKKKQLLMPAAAMAPVFFGVGSSSGTGIDKVTSMSTFVLAKQTGFYVDDIAALNPKFRTDEFMQGGALVLGGWAVKKFAGKSMNKALKGVPVGI